MNELQGRLCLVAELVLYESNPRTHSNEQIAQIPPSIQQLGWTDPISASPDNILATGHIRLVAAEKLRVMKVPGIVLGHRTWAEFRDRWTRNQ